jgi:hypothetical protein
MRYRITNRDQLADVGVELDRRGLDRGVSGGALYLLSLAPIGRRDGMARRAYWPPGREGSVKLTLCGGARTATANCRGTSADI